MSIPAGNPPAPTYQHDVFVSYRRESDYEAVQVSEVAIWVGKWFVPMFRKKLETALGERARVFWDEDGIATGQKFTGILEYLKRSRCIVPVVTKSYFKSTWCLAEWLTFAGREKTTANKQPLVLPICWHDGNEFPEGLNPKSIKMPNFKRFALTSPAFDQTALYVEFEQAVSDFADGVAEVLKSVPTYEDTWPIVTPEDVNPDNYRSDGQWRSWGGQK